MLKNDWKIDVLKDLYDTINDSQCIIYINSKKKLMDVHENLTKDNSTSINDSWYHLQEEKYYE